MSLFLCTDKPNALSEPRGEEESLTKKGKKKKSVRWAEEEQLKEYFYFDLDETERGKERPVSLAGSYMCPDEVLQVDDARRLFLPQWTSIRLRISVKQPSGSWWWTGRRSRWPVDSHTTPWKSGCPGRPRDLWPCQAVWSTQGPTAVRSWRRGIERWASSRRSSSTRRGEHLFYLETSHD